MKINDIVAVDNIPSYPNLVGKLVIERISNMEYEVRLLTPFNDRPYVFGNLPLLGHTEDGKDGRIVFSEGITVTPATDAQKKWYALKDFEARHPKEEVLGFYELDNVQILHYQDSMNDKKWYAPYLGYESTNILCDSFDEAVLCGICDKYANYEAYGMISKILDVKNKQEEWAENERLEKMKGMINALSYEKITLYNDYMASSAEMRKGMNNAIEATTGMTVMELLEEAILDLEEFSYFGAKDHLSCEYPFPSKRYRI